MLATIKSTNPYLKGTIFFVGIVSYAYYLKWLGESLNIYLPKYHLGYIIVGICPVILGIVIHVTGIYKFSFKILRKTELAGKKAVISHEQADPYGVFVPIDNYKLKLEKILESIYDNHFEVDDSLLVSLYCHGLGNVRERFLTTTYLTSSFWAHGKQEVIDANLNMLTSQHERKKDIRRLFLLRSSIVNEIKLIGNRITDYRSKGEAGEAKIQQMLDDFYLLRKTCDSLQKKHCEIRYFQDEGDHSSIDIIKNRTEIAIYDNFRIDYFVGGDDAKITGIKVFTEKHDLFHKKNEEVTQYFEALWKRALPIGTLLDKMENAYKYFSEKIDYTFPRLIRFDCDLSSGDKDLKENESDIVLSFLKKNYQCSSIKSYLDIGTCTGRYPFRLNGELPNAAITGIDADEDCIEYCNIQKEDRSKKGEQTKNIIFKKINFLHEHLANPQFELITCMLGTISHFGWNKEIDFKDDLQTSLFKMKTLLSDEGLLIISNWTEFGLDGQILGIYDDIDRKRLREFSESTDDLKKRLLIFFDVLEVFRTTDNHLDVIFCKKKSS